MSNCDYYKRCGKSDSIYCTDRLLSGGCGTRRDLDEEEIRKSGKRESIAERVKSILFSGLRPTRWI